MIPGRVEAKLTVPSGTQVSASTAAHASPVTVTVPAGDYYLTAAGGVPGLLETLQDALNADAPPSSGGWTVSLGDDGRVTIACSEPAAIAFTSTALRDLLGFEYNFDYPATADQVAAAAGFGTWSAGYLCNEASGNLSPAFGPALALSPTGTITYEKAGPRGPGDKAIAMDTTGEGFTESTNALGDADASSDLAVFAVLKTADVVSVATHAFSKSDFSGGAGFVFSISGTESLTFQVDDGPDSVSATCSSMPIDTWCVVGFVLDRSTNRIRVGFAPLSEGVATVGTEANASAIGSLSSSTPFRICRAGTIGGELQVAAFYVATGAGAAAGMSANLATALANFVAYMKGQTSTKAARGVWCPGAALNVEGSDPRRAPRVTDLRTTTSPTGRVLGLVGTGYRRHRNVTWELVPEFRVWEASADVPNNTWETFFADTQLGEHAWFGVSSPIQIYDHAGNRVGQDADVSGWQITGLDSIDPKRVGDWTGLWTVTLPAIVSSG